MKKTKTQKGITLIALIITIVVLLILAVVAINSIQNDGILGHAQNAAGTYNNAVANEQAMLDSYLGFLESGESATTFEDATKSAMLQKKVNSTVYDEYGNKIVVPAGFKIRVDEGTRTKGDAKSTATHVTEGIVIEDEDGNQFVWVPVGKIYTDTARTEANAKTITLGRYSNFVPDANGVYTPVQTAANYATATSINGNITEDTAQNHNSSYENAIARNIGDFVTSATQNGGYYFGRFEAGNSSNTLVCKTGQAVYNYITQQDASEACKNMYNNGVDGYKTGTFSSDLINSYAWDTAIIFIQTFGGTAASDYYIQNNCTSITTTGYHQDEYCNINDMSGNTYEWSTESADDGDCGWNGMYRGGTWDDDLMERNYSTCYRPGYTGYSAWNNRGFRTLLYVAL